MVRGDTAHGSMELEEGAVLFRGTTGIVALCTLTGSLALNCLLNTAALSPMHENHPGGDIPMPCYHPSSQFVGAMLEF